MDNFSRHEKSKANQSVRLFYFSGIQGLLKFALTNEYIVYTVLRPMESLSPEASGNKENACTFFRGIGVNFQTVEEEIKLVSFGFARQTLEFAHTKHLDLVAIMPHSSNQYRYMADAEKERMLTNEHGVAILCAGIEESAAG